ncbi:MAG: UDP-N-acetylmuramate--L-alanine ligase [Clostridia bacterium]|nr:UDP-N-acetylmuramate--L-alanine ligase [Clostridia bacterium]
MEQKFEIDNLQKGDRIHFIGVGGVSMSALAEILLVKGFHVSGSDRETSPGVRKLEKLGLTFYLGQQASHVMDATLVVYTAAISDDNPELAAARQQGIQTIGRSELLGAIMKDYPYSIAVSGTHGKTTTTSMLSEILLADSCDPTILVGGNLKTIGGNLKLGQGPYFLAEACEYCRSFLDFYPYCAVVLNAEPDHLDYYKDKEDYQGAFRDFVAQVSYDGFLAVNADDADVMDIAAGADMKLIRFGITAEHLDVAARNIRQEKGKTCYDLEIQNNVLTTVTLQVSGNHNILNSLAALTVAYGLGLDMHKSARALANYSGVDRRFQYKGRCVGADVYDDYAHHPTEIKATLSAAQQLGYRKIWCVFQPHTYSRTKEFFGGFAHAFEGVDTLILADIYAAREIDDGSVSSKMLAGEIKQNGISTFYMKEFSDIAAYLKENAAPGELIITMGAGDVTKISDMLTEGDRS